MEATRPARHLPRVDTHRVGRRFEELAADWLVRAGWRILDRNTRYGRREIDLVARRGSLVAFIEVKGRRSDRCGDPLEAITARKRAEIEEVARFWVERHGTPGLRYRFDAIAVRRDARGGLEVEHVEDAWRPGWR
jgi:putative endonuclease